MKIQGKIALWEHKAASHNRARAMAKQRLVEMEEDRQRKIRTLFHGAIGTYSSMIALLWSYIALIADYVSFADRGGAITMVLLFLLPLTSQNIRKATGTFLWQLATGK